MNEKIRSQICDIKKVNSEELPEICGALREEIIKSVEKCGGHLASNLGVVELTVALHRVLELPEEKLIFDVSHQAYVHKMLSGRLDGFEHLRDEGGISGFQSRSESEYDFFGGGHSGTAISAALGFAEAEKLNGGKRFAVAVVGDGSFTNGMVYEALNNASKNGLRMIIILNDNEMSISKNVGGMSKYFDRLRTSPGYFRLKRGFKNKIFKLKIIGRPIAAVSTWLKNTLKRLVLKENIFENLGLDYLGPVDGHDISKLEQVLREAKRSDLPTVVHVCTVKGKGYDAAEEKPSDFHALPPSSEEKKDSSFSVEFGKCLTELARDNERIVAISAAMSGGTGLNPFRAEFPERFFDVGIAESHAVTFAAGLAASGKVPIFAVYSAFLQRSFDQMIHDISIQNLHVVYAIDRSGFVPGDGATHQGIFDLAFMLTIPKMTVYTPANYADLRSALSSAVSGEGGVAVRYPKGAEREFETDGFVENDCLRYKDFGSGKRINIVTYGTNTADACDAAKKLSENFSVRIVGIKRVKPFNAEDLYKLCKDAEFTLFIEEQIKIGGFFEHISSELSRRNMPLGRFEIKAVDEEFPSYASSQKLRNYFGIDGKSIVDYIITTNNNS